MEPSRHRLTGWWGWGVQGALPPSLLLQSTATGWDAGNANGDLKEFKKEGKRRGYGGMSVCQMGSYSSLFSCFLHFLDCWAALLYGADER